MTAPAAPPPGHEIYVYYRVALDDAGALEAAATRMQADLCMQHDGLSSARLLRRPDVEDGLLTCMEAYCLQAGTPFEPLATRIEHAAAATLRTWIRGPRHVEHFVACAS